MPLLTDIANALVAMLNAADYTVEFTAALSYRPMVGLKEMDATVLVSVVPRAIEYERVTRDGYARTCGVDIGIQARLQTRESAAVQGEVETLLGLAQEIALGISGQRLPGLANAVCTTVANDPIYAPEHLEQKRLFTSVLQVTVEVGP